MNKVFPLEIWIGDLRDYKAALRLEREEYKAVLVYEFDSDNTRNYLFRIDFSDERPNWKLILKYAIDACYSIICTGGDFSEIRYPGIKCSRNVAELQQFH